MRTILVVLALLLFFLGFLPVYLVLFLLRRKFRRGTSIVAQTIVKYAFKFVMFFSGMKTICLGIDNVPKDKAVLYVSNHRSIVDIPAAYMTLPNLTGFISKIENKKIPFLSWWMELVNCLFLDRDDMRAGMKTILTAIDYVKDGYSIFIAPEGTRSQGTELLPFKEGSLKIADKTNCLIIPVAISGTDDVFENNGHRIKKATCVIEYGTPIDPEALTKEERKCMGAMCRDIITEMLKGHTQYVENNPANRK